MTRKRWIQDPVTHKLIPAEEYQRPNVKTPYIKNDIEAFQSPVDGSVITSSKQLREHNKRNNVVQTQEYGEGYFERKHAERQQRAKDGAPQKEINQAVADTIKRMESRR